jgi:hypothetical protein
MPFSSTHAPVLEGRNRTVRPAPIATWLAVSIMQV